MSDVTRPIVIVGAGRSGSSLLHELIGAHPSVTMFGEMFQSVAHLWNCFWEFPSAVRPRSERLAAALRRELPDLEVRPDDEILRVARALDDAERRGAVDLIRRTLADFYRLADLPGPCWGYKEIWIDGPPTFWTPYDAIFPEAVYVHLIRDPFAHARSIADWSRIPFSLDLLQQVLPRWVGYTRFNRDRAATGRYVEFTYEALLADPRRHLSAVFERVGLPWDDACLAALKKEHGISSRRTPYPVGGAALVATVPGLQELMDELGYCPPKREGGTTPGTEGSLATPLPEGGWQLHAPFDRDGQRGWLVRLSFAPPELLVRCRAEGDDLQQPHRSTLRLYEDGRPFGRPHSLHMSIREVGLGRYSHWGLGDTLLFSTPDNSDPNVTGRTYTLRFEEAAQARAA